MSDEQNVNEPVEVQPEPTTEAQPETPQEPVEEAPEPEEAPDDTEAPADAPDAPVQQEPVLEIPASLTDAYEDVRVVTLTGGVNVVLAKASVLSNHDEQRISGEFPPAAEAVADAERVLKLQSEDAEETHDDELQPELEEAPQSSEEQHESSASN